MCGVFYPQREVSLTWLTCWDLQISNRNKLFDGEKQTVSEFRGHCFQKFRRGKVMWLPPISNHCLLSGLMGVGPMRFVVHEEPKAVTWDVEQDEWEEELVRGGGDRRGQKDKQSWLIPEGETIGTSPNKPVSTQEGPNVPWFPVLGGCKMVCIDFILQSRLPLLEQCPTAWIILQVPLPLLCHSKQKQF